jgi:hypothetical protein
MLLTLRFVTAFGGEASLMALVASFMASIRTAASGDEIRASDAFLLLSELERRRTFTELERARRIKPGGERFRGRDAIGDSCPGEEDSAVAGSSREAVGAVGGTIRGGGGGGAGGRLPDASDWRLAGKDDDGSTLK